MHHDEKLKEKLLTYIEDAYALENQIIQVLESQVKRTQNYPDIQSRVTQHLEATRQHRARMEQRLNAYGKSPSAIKGAATSIMGNTIGATGGTRTDALAKDSRDDYVTEHMEIAAYTMLIATANAFGDQETMRAAELNLRDEVEMQQWLAQHAAEVTLLALQQDGINIPDSAWQFARQSIGETHPAEALVQKGVGAKDTTAKDYVDADVTA